MSDALDQAREGIDHAGEAAEAAPAHGDGGARRVAVLISVLAAALAVAEMGEKSAQNEYLSHHIAASDTWAFYQAKTIRADLAARQAETLASLPNAGDAAVRARIAEAQAAAARLEDDAASLGRKQLRAAAEAEQRARDEAGHAYHRLETVVGGLQIAIVLASVSVVTRMRPLALAAGALGGVAAAFGVGVWLG